MLNLRDLKGGLSLRLAALLLFSLFIFISCTAKVPSLETKETYDKWRGILENQTTPRPKEERKEERLELKPKLVPASPLQKRINVAFYQEYYENILSFISIQAGLSFILDPELKKVIPEDKARLSFQFVNQPLEEVIKKVCEVLDVYPKIERGVLYILPFEERIFNLGFLPVVKGSRANLGGDVLGNIATTTGGGGGTALTSPLKGEFTITAELSPSYLEVYKNLEQTVKGMLSKSGMYQLNLSAGILYVKDRPSNVKAIDRFIKEFSAKYRKQILLDAQIIEVELNKEHNLGIDWFQITNYLMGNNRVAFNTLDLGITTRTPEPNQPSVSLTISGQPNVNILLKPS
jgi:MSHA biogenesis protein MshL